MPNPTLVPTHALNGEPLDEEAMTAQAALIDHLILKMSMYGFGSRWATIVGEAEVAKRNAAELLKANPPAYHSNEHSDLNLVHGQVGPQKLEALEALGFVVIYDATKLEEGEEDPEDAVVLKVLQHKIFNINIREHYLSYSHVHKTSFLESLVKSGQWGNMTRSERNLAFQNFARFLDKSHDSGMIAP